MTDPEPLKRVSASPFARQLLESARTDHSAFGAANRALGALGIAGTVSLASASAAHASTVKASASLGVVGKYIALGLLGGMTTFGSAAYVLSARVRSVAPVAAPSAPSSPARDTKTAPEIPALHAPVTDTDPPTPTPLPAPLAPAIGIPGVAHELPAASSNDEPRSALPAEAAFPESPRVSASNNASTSAQLAALQAVRAALAAHAPSRALALLSDFDTRYRSTALAEEATVLRVEALTDAGRKIEAAALGASFLQKNPHSAYAQRVRSKLEQR